MALIDYNFVNFGRLGDVISSLAATLSAIVTGFMAYFTWKSVKQGREQLTEMKIQREQDNDRWNEENRPCIEIVPMLPTSQKWGEGLGLEIRNIGNKTAKEVKIEIDKAFIQSFNCDIISENINHHCERKYRILPNKYKQITLCRSFLVTEIIESSEGKWRVAPVEGSVFGKRVCMDSYNTINDILNNFSFNIKCTYEWNNEMYSYEETLTTRDMEYESFNYFSYIEEIHHDLSEMQKSIESISERINNDSTNK